MHYAFWHFRTVPECKLRTDCILLIHSKTKKKRFFIFGLFTFRQHWKSKIERELATINIYLKKIYKNKAQKSVEIYYWHEKPNKFTKIAYSLLFTIRITIFMEFKCFCNESNELRNRNSKYGFTKMIILFYTNMEKKTQNQRMLLIETGISVA